MNKHILNLCAAPLLKWSDMPVSSRKDAVVAMSEAGSTRSQIADSFGLSSSALIGWCWRNGVTISNKRIKIKVEAPQIPDIPVDPIVWDDGGNAGVLLVELTGCRWPIGEGDSEQRFCGHKKARGSYCENHAKIAFLPKATKSGGVK